MASITRIVGSEHALLTPGEVARLAGVDTKTVARWSREGKLRCIRTLGGHRRFMRADVEALLNERAADL